jgi:putative SOS response-associated peptidase YedK
MIITEHNDFAAEIHFRMPAFLTHEQLEPWPEREGWSGISEAGPERADDGTLIERVELVAA